MSEQVAKAEKRTHVNPFSEVGKSGLKAYGGYIQEEFLKDLKGSKGAKMYREMADNDAIIGASLYVYEQVVQSSDITVEGGRTAEDEAAREFVDSALQDMSMTWNETLTEILTVLRFGWELSEVVYKKRMGDHRDPSKRSRYNDGRIGWRKWASRAQDSLDRWDIDDQGGIQGMYQRPPNGGQLLYIPMEKALLFRTRTLNNNPEGQSLLRRAYQSYYMKKHLSFIEAVGIERDIAGLPKMRVPAELMLADAGTTEAAMYEEFKKIGTSIRADEQGCVIIPSDRDDNGNFLYEIDLMASAGSKQLDTSKVVERYDQRIAISMLTDFLLLGHEQVGSFALSSDKTNLFTMAASALLDSILSVINRHAIPRLLALNHMTPETMPYFKRGDVQAPKLAELGPYIQQLAGAGFELFPNQELEDALMRAARLPLGDGSTERGGIAKRGGIDPADDLRAALGELRTHMQAGRAGE